MSKIFWPLGPNHGGAYRWHCCSWITMKSDHPHFLCLGFTYLQKEILNEKEKVWWWNETIESLVKQKRKQWKEWQKGGSKEKCLEAKRKAKSDVYVAKRKAQEEKFSQLESSDGKNFIFKLAKRMKHQDIVGDKCVKNDKGCLSYNDSTKLKAWQSHLWMTAKCWIYVE